MNKAYRYRIYPNREQEILMAKTFGCVRFVYNKLLEGRLEFERNDVLDGDDRLSYKAMTPAVLKESHEWLKEVDSLALANCQLNFRTAWSGYKSGRAGQPRFKSKRKSRDSYTTNNQRGTIRLVDDSHIRLPKMKDVKIELHRPIPEGYSIKSATISRSSSGKYTISILTEYEGEIEQVIPSPEKTLGLDYRSRGLFVDSEGVEANYPGYYRASEERLKKAQKKLSRRQKGGKNRQKQIKKVAILHEKVANQRKDHLHKKSRQIANAWDAVVIEDLNMRGLAQGLNLGKSTMDNGFGMFRGFLKYKMEEQGKKLVVIDKWYPSSKTCNRCGAVNQNLKLGERTWVCGCGMILDRDHNAAINIKREGIRLMGYVS